MFSIYAVSLYTLYTGCLKSFLADMVEYATALIFTYVQVLFVAVGNTMLKPNLVSVRCCTVTVRNQFGSLKYEQRVNMGEKSFFSVTSLVNEKYGALKR